MPAGALCMVQQMVQLAVPQACTTHMAAAAAAAASTAAAA